MKCYIHIPKAKLDCVLSPLIQLRLVSRGSDQCGPPVCAYLCKSNISSCIYGEKSNPFETQQRPDPVFHCEDCVLVTFLSSKHRQY